MSEGSSKKESKSSQSKGKKPRLDDSRKKAKYRFKATKSQAAVNKAVKRLGGQSELARALSEEVGHPLASQNVNGWVQGRATIPAIWARAIHELTEGEIKASELRSDLYSSNW